MKVKLVNADECVNFFENWSKMSSVCYDSEIDDVHPDRIGKGCLKSGHFSGSRAFYFMFEIEEIPRFVADQLFRHSIGTAMNMASFRYVSKDNFKYAIPDGIKDSEELMEEYKNYMNVSSELYEKIQEHIGSGEKANEQARYVLPMSTLTNANFAFTIEALINFMNKRLCVRAEKPIRTLARAMRDEVIAVLPELKPYLVSQCESLLYCPEGSRGCGKLPSKQEVKKLIKSI